MASRPRRMKYIRDIPPLIRQQICEFFDDLSGLKNWRNLAAIMGFDNDSIHAFQLSMQRLGGSPTEDMLTEWDHGNHTIEELFHKMYKLQHVRCMMLLKDLVNPSLHHLIDELQPTSPENTGPHPANIPPTPQYNYENNFGYPAYTANHQQPSYHKEQPGTYRYYQQQQLYGNNNTNFNGAPRDPTAPSYNSNPSFPAPDPSRIASVCLPGNATANGSSNNTSSDNLAPQYHHEMGQQMGPPIRYVSHNSDRDNMADPPPSVPDIKSLSSTSFKAPDCHQSPRSGASSECSVDQCLSTTIKVDFAEISKATDDFSDKKKIGEGAFGKVYHGRLSNMTEVAIKKIIKNDNVRYDQSIRKDQIREISALATYRHENIVTLLSFSMDKDDNVYLIFPYMKNGSLEKSLEPKSPCGPLDWRRRHCILEGAARGIFYLHTGQKDHPLIHQDIKSANILLDENFVAKIADFGLARAGPTQGKEYTVIKSSVVFGTKAYLAPEFTANQTRRLSTKLDVYSFGVVMMEVVTGEKAGASKDRFRVDNLLTRNVDHILYTHNENPQKAVDELLDPRCPNWPSHHVLALLQLAVRCADDFKRRPQMEEVLKSLIAINKKVDEEMPCSSERNVQPTENTEPQDSRPGEESSCPISNNSDSYQASNDPSQWPSASVNNGRQQIEVHQASTYTYGGQRGNMQPGNASKMADPYAGLHVLASGPDLKKAQGQGIRLPDQLRMWHPDQMAGHNEAHSRNGYIRPPISTPSTNMKTSPPLLDSTTPSSSVGSSYPSEYQQQQRGFPSNMAYQQSSSRHPYREDRREQFNHFPGARNGQEIGYDPRMGFNPNVVHNIPMGRNDPRFGHDSRLGYDSQFGYSSDRLCPKNGPHQQHVEGSFRNRGDGYQQHQVNCYAGLYPPGAYEGRRSPPGGPCDLIHRGTPGHPCSTSSTSSSAPSKLTGSVPASVRIEPPSSSQNPNQPVSSFQYPKMPTLRLTSIESSNSSNLTGETSMPALSDHDNVETQHPGVDPRLKYPDSDLFRPQNGHPHQNFEGSLRNGADSYQPQQGYGHLPSGNSAGQYPPGRSPPGGPGDLIHRGTPGRPCSPSSTSSSAPSSLTGSVPTPDQNGSPSSSQNPNHLGSSVQYLKMEAIEITSTESSETFNLAGETCLPTLLDHDNVETQRRVIAPGNDANATPGKTSGEQVCLQSEA